MPCLSQGEKRRDEIIEVATYYTRINTMNVGIFVTSKNFMYAKFFGLSNYIVEFEEFNIAILYNFEELPSPPNSLEEFNYPLANADGFYLY